MRLIFIIIRVGGVSPHSLRDTNNNIWFLYGLEFLIFISRYFIKQEFKNTNTFIIRYNS